MLTKSVLIVAAAAAVSAELYPGHNAIKRALEARQTGLPDIPTDIPGGAIPTCIQPLLSLYSSLPTPPPELSSITVKDPCAPFTIPPNVEGPYSSYTSKINSWFGEHSSEIFDALSSCPQITSIAGDAIASITGSLCESTAAPAGGDESSTGTESAGPEETGDHHTMDHGSGSGSGSGSATGTGTGTGTGGSGSTPTGTAGGAAQTSSKSTAGAFAARETGFAGAAIAAGAFFGAVALL